jgi:hypothetical protein
MDEVIKMWRFQKLPSNPDSFDAACSIFRQITMTTTTTPAPAAAASTLANGRYVTRSQPPPLAPVDYTYHQYNCILCGHDPKGRFYSQQAMNLHCQDPNHVAMVQDVIEAQNDAQQDMLECLVKYDAMVPRIEKLGLQRWRHHVRSDLCTYLGSVGQDYKTMIRATNHLQKYEHLERISLLELVAWKAACVADTEANLSLYEMMEWLNHGWKTNKTKLQRCTAVTNVIVQNVVEFLEMPRKCSTVKDCRKALLLDVRLSSTNTIL